MGYMFGIDHFPGPISVFGIIVCALGVAFLNYGTSQKNLNYKKYSRSNEAAWEKKLDKKGENEILGDIYQMQDKLNRLLEPKKDLADMVIH